MEWFNSSVPPSGPGAKHTKSLQSVFLCFPPQWVINYKLSSFNNLVQGGVELCVCHLATSHHRVVMVGFKCLFCLLTSPPPPPTPPPPTPFPVNCLYLAARPHVKREGRESRGFRRRRRADTLISPVYQSRLLTGDSHEVPRLASR